MTGVPFIRFYGDDWLSGTNDLSLEERGALVTIVGLISTHGGGIKNDTKRLARRFGCTPNKAKKLVSELVDLGKIYIEDGLIFNERALKEIKNSQEFSKKQSENARGHNAKKREKTNKNNDDYEATAKPRLSQPIPEPIKENIKRKDDDFDEVLKSYPVETSKFQKAKDLYFAAVRSGVPHELIVFAAKQERQAHFKKSEDQKRYTLKLDNWLDQKNFEKHRSAFDRQRNAGPGIKNHAPAYKLPENHFLNRRASQ